MRPLPIWARATGVLFAVMTFFALLVTVVLPSQARDAAATVVAGAWDCELDYAETDENPSITTDWDLELEEDGRIVIEDQTGEVAEGEWTFEDGRLDVDFGEADLGNPELVTETIDVESSLDEIVLEFAATAQDRDQEVGDRTLTCERD